MNMDFASNFCSNSVFDFLIYFLKESYISAGLMLISYLASVLFQEESQVPCPHFLGYQHSKAQSQRIANYFMCDSTSFKH
jgi:hypothetical protein